MPVVLVDNVKYSSITYILKAPAGEEGLKKLTYVPVEVKEQGYCINLRAVTDIAPHIQESETLTAYLIEIRDVHGKLVKRFKPFKQLEFRVGRFYYINEWVKAIAFSEEQSSELNIGDNYKVAILLTQHNTKPLLPFEIKPVGHDAEKIVENLSNIEKSLLTLVVEHSTLNKAIGYLYDSYTRLEENDVEGARTAVRNSLQVLRDEFLPEVTVTEEVESFREKMRGLINKLRDFVSYGGPHPGPAPRTTTELIVGVTTQIIEYLAKCIENRMLKI